MTRRRQRKIGILGGGSIGLRHAANLHGLGVERLSILEPSAPARERCPENLRGFLVEAAGEFWEREMDSVFVCTPSAEHLSHVQTAVSRGCDVFVEKPLASAEDGCFELATEAERRALITMVACNMRFHPGPAAVKRLLGEQRIGRVLYARIHTASYLPTWRPWQDYRMSYSADPHTGGVILDGVHEIDLALWYLGPATLRHATVRKAEAIGLPETDGIADLLLDHHSGSLSSVHLNFVQRNYSRGCQIVGETGTIAWDFSKSEVLVYGEDGRVAETVGWIADYDLNAMYVAEMEHFLDCQESREPTCNPLAGGLAVLKLACAAKECSR